MTLFPTFRRVRSHTNMRSTHSSTGSPRDETRSPPPPLCDCPQKLPVPQVSNRLRGDVSKIGYEALSGSTEGSENDGGGENVAGADDFEPPQLGRTPIPDSPSRMGLIRRVSHRWSAVVHSSHPPPHDDFYPPFDSLPLPSDEQSTSTPITTARNDRQSNAKRRASTASLSSGNSPSLSRSTSMRTPATDDIPLFPSHTITSSPSSSSSSLNLNLNLTISTRLDSNGHRVLASRRRTSEVTATPPKARRTRGAFGIGDDEESLWEKEETTPRAGGLSEAEMGEGVRMASAQDSYRVGLGLVTGAEEALRAEMERCPLDDSAPQLPDLFASRSAPTAPRRPRPPLAPLQPVSLTPFLSRESPTKPRRPMPDHQPIQLLEPPPPLDSSSPTKTSSALSSLTRAYSAYSSSTSSSSAASRRRLSLQQSPRRALSKRLSGGGGDGVIPSRAPHSASFGPPMSASSSRSALEGALISRRFSAPIGPLTPVDVVGPSSSSAHGHGRPSTPTSPSPSVSFSSIPPTPSSHSLGTGESSLLPLSYRSSGSFSSHSHSQAHSHSYGMSSSTYEHLSSRSISEQGHGEQQQQHARRASVVSFELPPSPRLGRRRTQTSGVAEEVGGERDGMRRQHRRSASDGEALLAANGRGRASWNAGNWGGVLEEGVQGQKRETRLFVRLFLSFSPGKTRIDLLVFCDD